MVVGYYSYYFFIGYLSTNITINIAITAGNNEKSDHIIVSTESVMDDGSTMALPISSVVIFAPARPRNKATSEPDMAVPNFCDIVPDEKISPVDELPFFFVA